MFSRPASSLPMLLAAGLLFHAAARAEVGKAQEVAPGVWFHEGDVGRRGHCNNGWIVFRDYVLVIDANFPSGAQDVIPKIRAVTDKPIRFVFDTHHHGDHAYGNQVWADLGATVVAHEGVLEQMKKFETGAFGGAPGGWENTAKNRPDVAATRLHPPTVVFPRVMSFDDGRHRVELHHLGVAHTRGDGFAWLPGERVLFTGDACVNGPYNYMGDGDSARWIDTLRAARRLNPLVVCPGHGLVGGPEILDQQLEYFVTLQAEVRLLVHRGLSPAHVKLAADVIRVKLQANDRIARYVGGMFVSQVGKFYTDLSGKAFETAWRLSPETEAALGTRPPGKPDRFAGFGSVAAR